MSIKDIINSSCTFLSSYNQRFISFYLVMYCTSYSHCSSEYGNLGDVLDLHPCVITSKGLKTKRMNEEMLTFILTCSDIGDK